MLGRLLEGTTLTERLLWGAGLFAASSLVSLAAVTAVLVALPVDYFREGPVTAPGRARRSCAGYGGSPRTSSASRSSPWAFSSRFPACPGRGCSPWSSA